jgi:YggT family protein
MRQILAFAYNALLVLIICNAILSWMPEVARTPFGRLVTALATPLLAPFRKLIPPVRMGNGASYLDLSPIVLLVLLQIVYSILLRFVG